MTSSTAWIAVGAPSLHTAYSSSTHSEQVGMIGIRLQLNRCWRKYLIRTYTVRSTVYGIWIWIWIWIWISVPNPGPSYLLLLSYSYFYF